MRYRILHLSGSDPDWSKHPEWHDTHESATRYLIDHFICHQCRLEWVNFHIHQIPESEYDNHGDPSGDPSKFSTEYPPCLAEWEVLSEDDWKDLNSPNELSLDQVKNPSYN